MRDLNRYYRNQARHRIAAGRTKFSKLLLDSLPGIFYLHSYPDLRLLR